MTFKKQCLNCSFAFTVLALLFSNAGCSDQDSNQNQGHVWQEQTDTLDKARAVEDMILDSAEQQQKDIEEQTR